MTLTAEQQRTIAANHAAAQLRLQQSQARRQQQQQQQLQLQLQQQLQLQRPPQLQLQRPLQLGPPAPRPAIPFQASVPRPPAVTQQPPRPPPPLYKVTAQAALISRSRFAVRTTQYCLPLIDFGKHFKTAKYDAVNRVWHFDLADYLTFEKKIRVELRDFVLFEGLPKFITEGYARGFFAEKDATELEIDLIEKIPPYLLDSLLPYQREGVLFAVKNGGKILLADDMGLGKTVQAIAAAVYFQDSWPILCVCPSSMRFEWKEQWLRWVRDLKENDISVITGGRQTDNLINVKVAIITYDLLDTMQKNLEGRFFSIIFDECHHLKNYKASRTTAAVSISKTARRLFLLSGTPALSKPAELFPQIEIINKQIFKNFPDFGKRYCDGFLTSRGHWDYNGKSNVEELQIILQNTIMIRRMKEDVAKQLPQKIRSVVFCDPNLVKFQDDALSFSAAEYKNTTVSRGVSQHEIRKCLLNYYRHTGKAKLPAVVQYLKNTLEGNESLKVVIFAHHTHVLKEINRFLSLTMSGMQIDGGTPAEERKELCDQFQKDENCRFAALSITACSSGITLTAASLVVFAELYWNPGILAQAEDRLHRLGQKQNVSVKYLVAKDTADDHIWAMLKRKLEFLNQVGLSRDNLGRAETETQEATLPDSVWDQLTTDEMEQVRPTSPSKRLKTCV